MIVAILSRESNILYRSVNFVLNLFLTMKEELIFVRSAWTFSSSAFLSIISGGILTTIRTRQVSSFSSSFLPKHLLIIPDTMDPASLTNTL
jgi:hypothetical protein